MLKINRKKIVLNKRQVNTVRKKKVEINSLSTSVEKKYKIIVELVPNCDRILAIFY